MSTGGTPQLIIGNGFINKYPHATLDNINGLTLNRSSITNKHFIQGYLKGHAIKDDTTVIKNNKVILSNKVTLAPMDKQFLSYNFIEELPISKGCLRCSVLQCTNCQKNPILVDDVRQKQDEEIYKLLKYDEKKEHIVTDLPFNTLAAYLHILTVI